MSFEAFLIVSAVLFCIGLYGSLARRNVLAVLMSIELMFNAVNVTLVAMAKYLAPAALQEVLRMSGGTSILSELSREGLTVAMEDAIRLNVTAVTLSIFVGAEGERTSLLNLARLINEGERHGIPVLAVTAGGEWSIDTVAEGYFYGPLDIDIGPDDVAHIAYHDHQASSFQPDKGDAVYAVLRNGEWEVEAAFDQGHDGWDNRLTVDSNGRPHMSGIDPEEFNGNGVEYYHLNEAGEWVVEGVGSGALTYKYATSVAVDPEGNFRSKIQPGGLAKAIPFKKADER